jgi:hypothetical protein
MKRGITMEELIAMIADIGFPIGVSIYLLVRVERRIESLAQSISDLAHAIDSIEGPSKKASRPEAI